MGLDEEEYFKKFETKTPYVKGCAPSSCYRSLCVMIEGSCDVVNPFGEFFVHKLRVGDFFGAADLLAICEVEFFGDIIAGEDGCRVMVIDKPD